MTPQQFQRVETVFLQVRQVPCSQREEFLATTCRDDLTVWHEVNTLLECETPSTKLTELKDRIGAMLGRTLGTFREIDIGGSIGPYRLMRTLGEGGMGMVFLAEQTRPIRREVALKVTKAGMDTKEVVARFETERQALALMNHPNVARVYDAGSTAQGHPFFVMEFVPGVAITTYCDEHRPTTEKRLHLFVDVCHAIQHAHQKGIIHRDIKPSNALVSVEGDAEVLPVRVLHPSRYHRLVRLVEGVFEVLQADHQPGGLGRGPHVLGVATREARLEPNPIYLPGQLDQFMGGIQKLIEMSLEQLERVVRKRLGLHGIHSVFARVSPVHSGFLANSIPTSAAFHPKNRS